VTFFDTNALIYFTINQDEQKLKKAQEIIFDAIEQDIFFISPMVLSEYIFVLGKYGISKKHRNKVLLFSEYAGTSIDKEAVMQAYAICEKIHFCKNINDIIHLKVAEQHCNKLVTFDKDFRRLQKFTDIEIEILDA